LICFAHGRGIDLTLIETMPMGEIDGDRTDQYLGGCDIVREMFQSGDLQKLLNQKGVRDDKHPTPA
jgi:cyclic pyranopterin phosphate synthase